MPGQARFTHILIAEMDPRLDPAINRYLTDLRVRLGECAPIRLSGGLRRLFDHHAVAFVQEDIHNAIRHGAQELIIIGFTGSTDHYGFSFPSPDDSKEYQIERLNKCMILLAPLMNEGVSITPVLALLEPDNSVRFIDPS